MTREQVYRMDEVLRRLEVRGQRNPRVWVDIVGDKLRSVLAGC
jgi:hypothetical protein